MSTPASDASTASRIGQVVSGRYLIRELLGEGGMGAVYLAEHTHMRKRVALKLLHGTMSSDEEVLARFKREAEAAARIEHPNVAAATDFGRTDDGSFFLVLEYVEGTSLRDVVGQGSLSPARALHIARQIALALERAHAAGIVHRDLKPENVMLVRKDDDPDFVKVLDFGIAKLEPAQRDAGPQQALTRLGTILGTPEYMAPEQALGEAVGPTSDLYALGIILYEMLTGRHPFDAQDRMAVLSMHIVAPVPPMNDREPSPNVPAPIEAVVRKLLEKEAKARHANARELVDALREAAAASAVDFTPAPASRVMDRESMARIAPPSSAFDPSWSASDSLAKTSHGAPAVVTPVAPASVTAASVPNALRPAAQASPVDAAISTIKGLPRLLQVAIVAAIPLVILVALVVVLVVRRGTVVSTGGGEGGVAEGPSAALPTRATPEQIAAAREKGPAALEALRERFPEDAAVARELVFAHQRAGAVADALRSVRALLKLDPKATDPEIVQLVTGAASRPDVAEEAFALLEGPLGAKGVDALMDLSNEKTAPRETRTRATKSLARADVRANASPAASLVLDMKSANNCPAKRDIVERAKDQGDARILASLKSLRAPRGCGFMGLRDCWPCLRKDHILEDAIDAIEGRAGK